MRMLRGGIVLIAAAAILCGPAQAFSEFGPATGIAMSRGVAIAFGKRVIAPFGAIAFCKRQPLECKNQRGQAIHAIGGKVALNPRLLSLLRTVNSSVNRSIRPVKDAGGRSADTWRVAVAAGDCEDIALTKRAALIRAGFPSAAALVATARLPSGQLHAVLVVRTDRGDYVLDNLVTSIRPWNATGYRWKKIQSPRNPAVWLSM